MASLLLDLGNTRLKWAWLDAEGLSGFGAIVHSEVQSDAWSAAVAGSRVPDRIICSSVAKASLVSDVERAFCQRYGLEFERPVAGSQALGLTNSYVDPERMGVDRWLAMAAARTRMDGAICVIDAGTAITVDLVDGSGVHRGGWIAPGARLMRASLYSGTGRIPPEPAEAPGQWGKSTAEAVTLGINNAMAGLAARARHHAQAEFGTSVSFIVTGGDGEALLQYLDAAATLAPDLVLEGLALWACPEADRATD